MSLITRIPVFGVSDQVKLKMACSASEASFRLEILDIETTGTLYNTIFWVQANFRVSYPNRVILRV